MLSLKRFARCAGSTRCTYWPRAPFGIGFMNSCSLSARQRADEIDLGLTVGCAVGVKHVVMPDDRLAAVHVGNRPAVPGQPRLCFPVNEPPIDQRDPQPLAHPARLVA